MKKIPTIFRKDMNTGLVSDEPNPLCDWVFNGEGIATRKYDGACTKIENGKYYKRRTIKKGKIPPPDFIEVDFDPNTGKKFGWSEVSLSNEDKYYREVLPIESLPDGTYELVGPKIQGNVEKFDKYILIRHSGSIVYEGVPRTFDGLREWLSHMDIEGLVFHHPDGRMGKIKKKDFGLDRKVE